MKLSRSVFSLALFVATVLAVSHPHKRVPGVVGHYNDNGPTHTTMDVWTLAAIIWSIGALCLAWLGCQIYSWWVSYRTSTTYHTLLSDENQESTFQSTTLADSFSNYRKNLSNFSKAMTLISIVYVLYMSIFTFNICRHAYHHKLGFAGLTEIKFERRIEEVAVGATDWHEYLGKEYSVGEVEKILKNKKEMKETLADLKSPVDSMMTVIYDSEECSTLPSDRPSNDYRKWKFGCNQDGMAWYSLYEKNTLCEGDVVVEKQPLEDNVLELGEDEIFGDLVLTCDKGSKTDDGDYTQVIATQQHNAKQVPCDKLHLVKDVPRQMKMACDKYDSPDAEFTTYWECSACYGVKEGEDKNEDDWDVFDIQDCHLATVYNKHFLLSAKGHKFRDSGDALCINFKEADKDFLDSMEEKVGGDAHRVHFITSDGAFETATNDRFREIQAEKIRKHKERQKEIFHNHPERDNMVKFSEEQVGLTYNADTKSMEVAEGHTEESVLKNLGHKLDMDLKKETKSYRRTLYNGRNLPIEPDDDSTKLFRFDKEAGDHFFGLEDWDDKYFNIRVSNGRHGTIKVWTNGSSKGGGRWKSSKEGDWPKTMDDMTIEIDVCPIGFGGINNDLKGDLQITFETVATIEKCAKLCNSRSDACTSFEYSTDSLKCKTYNEDLNNIGDNKDRLESKSDWRSCLKEHHCPEPYIDIPEDFTYNPSLGMSASYEDSLEACGAWCDERPRCVVFEYNRKEKICSYYNEGVSNIYKDDDRLAIDSLEKSCFKDPVCPKRYTNIPNDLTNKNTDDKIGVYERVDNLAECGKTCDEEYNCTGFEFKHETRQCKTYHFGAENVGDDKDRMDFRASWKSCVRNPYCSGEFTHAVGTIPYLPIEEYDSITDSTSCAELCYLDEDCRTYQFSSTRKKCKLFSPGVEAITGETNEDFHSCYQSRCTWVTQPGYYDYYTTRDRGKKETKIDALEACDANSDCEAVTCENECSGKCCTTRILIDEIKFVDPVKYSTYVCGRKYPRKDPVDELRVQKCTAEKYNDGKYFCFGKSDGDAFFEKIGEEWDAKVFHVILNNGIAGEVLVWRNNQHLGGSGGRWNENAKSGDWDLETPIRLSSLQLRVQTCTASNFNDGKYFCFDTANGDEFFGDTFWNTKTFDVITEEGVFIEVTVWRNNPNFGSSGGRFARVYNPGDWESVQYLTRKAVSYCNYAKHKGRYERQLLNKNWNYLENALAACDDLTECKGVYCKDCPPKLEPGMLIIPHEGDHLCCYLGAGKIMYNKDEEDEYTAYSCAPQNPHDILLGGDTPAFEGPEDEFMGPTCDSLMMENMMHGSLLMQLEHAGTLYLEFAAAVACEVFQGWHKVCKKVWNWLGWLSDIICWTELYEATNCEKLALNAGFAETAADKVQYALQPYVDEDIHKRCGSPKLEDVTAGMVDGGSIRHSHSRRNLDLDDDFVRDVMQEAVGGDDEKPKVPTELPICEELVCENVGDELLFYPGWEAGFSATFAGTHMGFGLGYAGTKDNVVFTYVNVNEGWATELVSTGYYAMMTPHVRLYSDYLGEGNELCMGLDVTWIKELGFGFCLGWSTEEGKSCCNSYHAYVDFGIGLIPIAGEELIAQVRCLDAACHAYSNSKKEWEWRKDGSADGESRRMLKLANKNEI